MRTKTVNIYKFSELSQDAKEYAKSAHKAAGSYDWGAEALASLEALAEHFGGKLSDYAIDWSGDSTPSHASFDMPEMEKDEIAEKLAALGTYNAETLKGDGQCKLTGYCADEDAIDGFRIAFMREGVTDLGSLMQHAFDTWLEACQSDYRAFYEDDTFSEHCDANEYEFTEEGHITK